MPPPTELSLSSTLTLPNSTVQIPRLGFGVWEANGPQCHDSVLLALQSGYRHIGAAQLYRNEHEFGTAFRTSGLKRSEVFITTKLDECQGTFEKTYQCMLDSVTGIDGEDGYVGLFLVHSADIGKRVMKMALLCLEKLLGEGKTKGIGVSNYGIGDIEEMKEFATVWPPQVNQNELHPWCQQREVSKYCQDNGIMLQAYSPLARSTKSDVPTLAKIANSHNVTGAQVLIPYCLQKDWIPLPKIVTPSRIVQSTDVFDFELSEEDMKMLDDLDQGAAGALLKAVRNE